jgi:crotonobetainyl-CoA:carnitine CoA-transferase CaiB-like acyl-CoA transferase
MGALDDIRVIDFGHYVAGPVLGMLLADQGAEVIKVDPPGGPAFASPANATWNRGKKSICLDLKETGDRDVARGLINSADVLIENFRPGVMERFGLAEASLRPANPGLIYVGLPGFAATDPRASIQAWDGVILAATDALRPAAAYRDMVQLLHQPPSAREGVPRFTDEPIASMYAALIASMATTTALLVRSQTGVGQRVEVPLFDAMMQAVGVFAMSRLPFKAMTISAFSGFDHQYQCADSRWVHLVCTVPRHADRFAEAIGRPDLIERGMTARGAGANPELNQELTRALTGAFRTRPAAEWEALLVAEGLPGAMCRSPEEWVSHPQALESDLLVEVDDPELGRMRQPGPQVKLSDDAGAVVAPAPTPDQHRAEILESLAGVESAQDAPDQAGGDAFPLAGLRVLDLCIVLAGPTCGRTLAELGADVIKIDDPNRGQVVYHHDINRGKRSILLDLKKPEGLEIFWQLVETSDVIVQNYRMGVVEKLGIDYEAVRQRKPDIVYASLNAYGDTGPWAALPGYEESAQALTGMQVRFGGRGRPLLWPYGVINDYGTGYAGAYGVLMALLARRRSGVGQHVAAALARTACTLQSMHLQDYDGKDWTEPDGDDVLGPAPTYRLYECSDGWIFVGAKDASQFRPLFGDSGQLAESLARWCRGRPQESAVSELADAGIGAHSLAWINDVAEAPSTRERGLIVAREHEKLGMMRTTGPGPWFSQSSVRPGCPAPLPGRDAESVLTDIGRAQDLQRLLREEVLSLP